MNKFISRFLFEIHEKIQMAKYVVIYFFSGASAVRPEQFHSNDNGVDQITFDRMWQMIK